MKHTISDNFEALVLALELALTAPSTDKSKKCADIVDQLADLFQVSEVELAKQIAISNVFGEYQ
tara:strand:- start:75 stop:266 length:192 start_codon:yes stop_codon:yes gene_type:complete